MLKVIEKENAMKSIYILTQKKQSRVILWGPFKYEVKESGFEEAVLKVFWNARL
jgi:hypothetical protein